jgi:hypothetical protein
LFITLFVIRAPWHAALATAAVVAVQSTTGMLIAVLLLGMAYARYLQRTQASQVLVAAIVGAALVAPVSIIAYDNLVTKTSGVLRGSSWAREYDLRTGLAVIAAHPVTGLGFSYERYYEEAERLGYRQSELSIETLTDRPNSNGVVWLGVTMGIPLAILFLLSLFHQPFFHEKWLFFGVIGLSSLAEALLLTPFLLMFAFAGMMSFGAAQAAPARVRRLSA